MIANKDSFILHSLQMFFVLILVTTTNAQNNVNDECVLPNGIQGECTRFENCPAAIELVRNRAGRPQQCGFEGRHPIVCCENQAPFTSTIKKAPVGDLSKQLCKKYYEGLPEPTVQVTKVPKSTTPMSTTTESEDSGEFSIADLIEQAKKEEEELRKAGKPTFTVHKSAVGGVDAKPKQFPHMAVLGYGSSENITWACGGSLISERHVLTAAHCIYTPLGRVAQIRIGDLNLNIITDDAKPQTFGIGKIFIYPEYKAPAVYHDIAIIELSSSAIIDEYVRPACLQTDTAIRYVESYSATGWGVTSYLGSPAEHLQDVTLQPFTFEDCSNTYRSTSKRRLANGIDDSTQICAGEDSKDTCQGDSGGPLQIRNGDFPRGYTVIGVTSFGKACGIGKGPSVYIRVSYYIGWIESIIKAP